MQSIDELLNYVAVFRGQFINRISYVERSMEIIIANHYCKDPVLQIEFIDFILGERFISFEGKRTAFDQIIKKHHSKISNDYKEMFEKLSIVQNQRNKLAHYMTCLTDEAMVKFQKDKTFGLVQYLDKKHPVWFDMEKQTQVTNALDDLQKWFAIN